MVTGAFATSGFFFFTFCGLCAWCGLNGRVRGGGRSKWAGVQEMRIDRPQLGGATDRGYYPTQSKAGGGFFESLPVASQRVDAAREGLLQRC